MPIYFWNCNNCKKEFSASCSVADRNNIMKCEHCGSEDTEREKFPKLNINMAGDLSKPLKDPRNPKTYTGDDR